MTKLEQALRLIGSQPELAANLIQALREIEPKLAYDGPARDDITGPIADALFAGDQTLVKQLANGTELEFLYRSKIAREFVLSNPERPDHAWEPQTTKLLVHFAARARSAVVGGAYFGDHSILMAKAMSACGGRVHAFEPNREQAEMLRRNAQRNSLTNIDWHAKALWDVSAVRLQLSGEDALAHSEAADERSDNSFLTDTIDHYAESIGLESLELIMLDIEGGELRALQGAVKHLAHTAELAPVVVFEMHAAYVDWSEGLDRTPVIKLLHSHGYQVFAVRDYNANVAMAGAPIELVPSDQCYLAGPPHGFNMLAIKNPSLIQSPLFRICPNVSPKLLKHKDPLLHAPLHW